MAYVKPKSTKTEIPRLVWNYLQVQAVEAHVFGADAALAFAYIRYTRNNDPNYEPSVRKLVANVPGLSNHRARFVMDCLFRKVYFEANELQKANRNFANIITELSSKNRNYKRLKKKGEANKDAVGQALATMMHIRNYLPKINTP